MLGTAMVMWTTDGRHVRVDKKEKEGKKEERKGKEVENIKKGATEDSRNGWTKK